MKNIKFKTIIIYSILSLLILSIFPGIAKAETADLQIIMKPEVIKQGETFEIQVTFSSKSEGISSLDASLSYDADLMEYTSGGSNTVQLNNGKGLIIDNGSSSTKSMSYSFQFLAKKEGKAKFSVEQSELFGHDTGKPLGNPKSSISLTIHSSPVQEEQDETNDPNEGLPNTEEDPIEVEQDGQLIYILRDYPESELPKDFEPYSHTFKGEEILGAKNPNTEMILLYGTDQSFNHSFYIYEQNENLFPYVTLNISGTQEYTFLPMDINPEGYQPEEIVINGNTVIVSKPEDFKGIYLVKALNSDNETGYYFYDESQGTIQRVEIHNNVVETQDEQSSFHWSIILLAGIALILLVLVIIFSSSYIRRRNKS
jgi:hypothetical protein